MDLKKRQTLFAELIRYGLTSDRKALRSIEDTIDHTSVVGDVIIPLRRARDVLKVFGKDKHLNKLMDRYPDFAYENTEPSRINNFIRGGLKFGCAVLLACAIGAGPSAAMDIFPQNAVISMSSVEAQSNILNDHLDKMTEGREQYQNGNCIIYAMMDAIDAKYSFGLTQDETEQLTAKIMVSNNIGSNLYLVKERVAQVFGVDLGGTVIEDKLESVLGDNHKKNITVDTLLDAVKDGGTAVLGMSGFQVFLDEDFKSDGIYSRMDITNNYDGDTVRIRIDQAMASGGGHAVALIGVEEIQGTQYGIIKTTPSFGHDGIMAVPIETIAHMSKDLYIVDMPIDKAQDNILAIKDQLSGDVTNDWTISKAVESIGSSIELLRKLDMEDDTDRQRAARIAGNIYGEQLHEQAVFSKILECKSDVPQDLLYQRDKTREVLGNYIEKMNMGNIPKVDMVIDALQDLGKSYEAHQPVVEDFNQEDAIKALGVLCGASLIKGELYFSGNESLLGDEGLSLSTLATMKTFAEKAALPDVVTFIETHSGDGGMDGADKDTLSKIIERASLDMIHTEMEVNIPFFS